MNRPLSGTTIGDLVQQVNDDISPWSMELWQDGSSMTLHVPSGTNVKWFFFWSSHPAMWVITESVLAIRWKHDMTRDKES